MIEASPPAPLQKRGEASLQLPGSEITHRKTLNHEVLATNQWCKPNAENELARAMLRRRPLMPNGNGSPKGNPEGLGEMMKRVLHAVQLAVPIGIITRPNIAQSAQQYTDFYLSV